MNIIINSIDSERGRWVGICSTPPSMSELCCQSAVSTLR
jgi:hypothetical protein